MNRVHAGYGPFLILLISGCAAAPAEVPRGAVGVQRVNDPTWGLPKFAEFREAMPIKQTRAYRDFSLESDPHRLPGTIRPDAPVEASMDRPASWVADFPVERTPARTRFFLSGFAAGFALRLGYAALHGASSGSVSGSDLGASVLMGLLTGGLALGYSYRIPAGLITPAMARDRIPAISETSTYREFAAKPPPAPAAGSRPTPPR